MIILDGSYGEGGGQILRTALSLSAILKKPFTINNIRKGRKVPGILPQHLTSIKAVKNITSAATEGDSLYSLTLKFNPKEIKGGEYYFNVAEEKRSAGSITLITQAILPILFFCPSSSRVALEGGTHVPFSPTFDYFKEVLLETIKKIGLSAVADIERYGFYPIGGGKVVLETKPQKIIGKGKLEWLERGNLRFLKVVSKVGRLKRKIAERQVNQALNRLKDFKPETFIEEVTSDSPGTYTFIKAEFDNIIAGFSALGEAGKLAEKVADEAVDEFLLYYKSAGAFDPHLADQILVFLALLDGSFIYKTSLITNHLLTNIWVIKNFIPEKKIEVLEDEKIVKIS